jgi:polysaccharide export outer membrane protein
VVATGIEEQPPAPWLVRVGDNGVAEVPIIGPLQLAGLRFPQAEMAIRSEGVRRGMYVNPTVSVGLAARHTKRVTVTGAVEEEGVYDVPAVNANLLAALMKAKGLNKEAGLNVEVRYPAPNPTGQVVPASFSADQGRTTRVNLADVANGRSPNILLEDGATVTVLRKPLNTFQVIGLVRRPNQFEMEPDHEYRLLEAIALAGERTLQIADKVHIIRRMPNQTAPVVIEASITNAKSGGSANIILAPGDVVSVEETIVTFTVGTIRDFVGFGFSAAVPGL